jgi:hypothetical protein
MILGQFYNEHNLDLSYWLSLLRNFGLNDFHRKRLFHLRVDRPRRHLQNNESLLAIASRRFLEIDRLVSAGARSVNVSN